MKQRENSALKDILLFNAFMYVGLIPVELYVVDENKVPNIDALNENGWQEFLVKWERHFHKIRFINPHNQFDYAYFGDYFFWNDELYVITDNPNYWLLNRKTELTNSPYESLIREKKYVIKGVFAGFYIGREDAFQNSIFYGDILKMEIDSYSKCLSCKFYNGPVEKERDDLTARGLLNTIYGPISLHSGWHSCKKSTEKFTVMDQWFGVIPSLCSAKKIEVVAHIYYDVVYKKAKKFNLNITSKAELTDYGPSCQFWEAFVPREQLIDFKGRSDFAQSRIEIWEYAVKAFRGSKNNQGIIYDTNLATLIRIALFLLFLCYLLSKIIG
jgi:hypothetical protein